MRLQYDHNEMPKAQAQKLICPQNSTTCLSMNVKGYLKLFQKCRRRQRASLIVSSNAKRKFMSKRVIPRDSSSNFWQNFSLPPFCWCCAHTNSEIKFVPSIWKKSTYLKVTWYNGVSLDLTFQHYFYLSTSCPWEKAMKRTS